MFRLPSLLIQLFLSGLLLTSMFASAQDPLTHLHGTGKNAFAVNSWFVVKRTPIDVYTSSQSSNPTPTGSVKLGTLFFAKAEDNGRLLLSKYDEVKGWTDELGWVRASDVLKKLYNPITIGKAIEDNLLTNQNYASSQESSGLSTNNQLFLRAVAQPNMLVKAGVSPGDQSGEVVNTWSWYSVFDIVHHNGEPWVLAGKNPQILPSKIVKNTNNQSASELLLGWLPLDKMTVWASNTVIELNTSRNSVSNRVDNNFPAIVFSQANDKSPELFKEPLDQYWLDPNRDSSDITSIIDFDPIGMSADVPRQIIIQNTSNWVEVASVGSLDNEINPSQMVKIKRDVKSIAQDLVKLDIAFVIDATGSMGEEIQAVQAFLDDLSQKMQAFQNTGTPISVGLAGENLQINSNLDISISLVGFQDIKPKKGSYNTKVYFSRKNVVHDAVEISDNLASIEKELDGGTEAIHDGMKRALENDLWRKESLDRIIVLIADEAGDTNDVSGVLDSMPSFTQAQLATQPKLQQLSQTEQKKDLTKVYSVFTGETKNYGAFESNVAGFSAEVHHIEGFNDPNGKDDLLKILLYQLKTQQQNIGKKLGAFNKMLSGQATSTSSSVTTLPGIAQLAIQQAVERSGVSLNDLKKLTKQAYYQGYVPIDQVQGINAASTAIIDDQKAFRVRVMLTKVELKSLQDTASKIATGLTRAVEQMLEGGDSDIFDTADDSSKQLFIAELLLLVRDQVSGSGTYRNKKEKLRSHAKKLVEAVNGGKWKNRSLARLMKVSSSLPMKNDGFLSRPLQDILASRPDELITIADNLNLKAIGLQRIIDNLTVPEDFNLVLGATTQETKNWSFTNGTQSTVKYVYIPLSYIP